MKEQRSNCLVGACIFFLMTWVNVTAGADFHQDVLPLLNKYCLTCHSTEKQKGELDLERFSSLR